MELAPEWVESYAALVGLDAGDTEKLRARLERGEAGSSIVRIAVVNGEVRAALVLLPIQKNEYVLPQPRFLADVESDERGRLLAMLLQEAVSAARKSGARAIGTRPPLEAATAWLCDALAGAGFIYQGERIEFNADVADLPDDAGTPLVWESMVSAGMAAAAEMLGAVSEGDPHGLEGQDPAEALEGYLSDGELTGDPDCVAIGTLDGRRVALVVAQVNPRNGWSRIAYMGLVPDVRGRGLGRWVHRHGFAMMRAQGGTRYQGGTSAENCAMIALFLSHGCREDERMQEWYWRA